MTALFMSAAPPTALANTLNVHPDDEIPGDYCHDVTLDGRLACTGRALTPAQATRVHDHSSEPCGRPPCSACAEITQ